MNFWKLKLRAYPHVAFGHIYVFFLVFFFFFFEINNINSQLQRDTKRYMESSKKKNKKYRVCVMEKE